MIPDTLKPNMAFTHGKRTITIVSIDDSESATIHDSIINRKYAFDIDSLRESLVNGGWTYEMKPLDKAMKQLDKQFCLHKNVNRDIYFTAKVFLTCRDCGKAMN